MTISELQTMRTSLIASINGTLAAGVVAYGLDGRNVQKIPLKDQWEMLTRIDTLIAQATHGAFAAVQFRRPE